MVKIKNFHENLEQSLARLGQQIEVERERPEAQKLSEQELVKQSIKSFANTVAPEEDAAVQSRDVSTTDESALPTYLQGKSIDSKIKLEVERLVDLVFHEGLEKAIKEASKHSPFIEDAFHDALVDKLLPELKKKGIIK